MTDKQSLKTVVMTDVAGFTEMMRTNEPQTLVALRNDLDMIRAHVSRNGGEVIKTAGDSILALFSSAPKAVRACIDSQEALSESTLKHRMAVHAGEITITSGDAYGDAVNVCARLETLTTPGTVTASRIVVDLIEAQGLPNPIKRGKVQLKGIDGSIEIFSWGAGARTHFSRGRLVAGIVATVVLASAGVAWKINSQQEPLRDHRSMPPYPYVTSNSAAVNQTLDDIWQDVDAYETVKAEAVANVDAQIAIDWLDKNPLGKLERGKLEIRQWMLVDRAIQRGRELAGPNATADQIWDVLNKSQDKDMDLELSAFADEFRRPK